MSPQGLLNVADELSAHPGPGAPLGAQLRRSISTSYYAAFHAATELVARQLGVHALTDTHEAIRRSISHESLGKAALEVSNYSGTNQASPKNPSRHDLAKALHASGAWTNHLRDLIELRELREAADYSTSKRFRQADARLAHATASRTVAFFPEHYTGPEGNAFATLVITARG